MPIRSDENLKNKLKIPHPRHQNPHFHSNPSISTINLNNRKPINLIKNSICLNPIIPIKSRKKSNQFGTSKPNHYKIKKKQIILNILHQIHQIPQENQRIQSIQTSFKEKERRRRRDYQRNRDQIEILAFENTKPYIIYIYL